MDVNFSKSDCCGEGAISRTDMTAVKFDEDRENIGNTMGIPRKNEFLDNTGTKILNGPRKRRTQSGRSLRAGV